nr:MAG: hypothetical protein [Microviridae sp.]
MKSKFRDPGTYQHIDSDYEHPSGVSMTVPDENMPISEILERFSHGIAPNISQEGYFSDTDDYDDCDPIINDLTDLDDLRNELQATYDKIENEKLSKKQLEEKQDLQQKVNNEILKRKSDEGLKKTEEAKELSEQGFDDKPE